MRKLWITLPLLFFGYVGNVESNDKEIHQLITIIITFLMLVII